MPPGTVAARGAAARRAASARTLARAPPRALSAAFVSGQRRTACGERITASDAKAIVGDSPALPLANRVRERRLGVPSSPVVIVGRRSEAGAAPELSGVKSAGRHPASRGRLQGRADARDLDRRRCTPRTSRAHKRLASGDQSASRAAPAGPRAGARSVVFPALRQRLDVGDDGERPSRRLIPRGWVRAPRE